MTDEMNPGVVPKRLTKTPLNGDDVIIHNSIGWHKEAPIPMVKKFVEVAAEVQAALPK